jgi:hypothetical protein
LAVVPAAAVESVAPPLGLVVPSAGLEMPPAEVVLGKSSVGCPDRASLTEKTVRMLPA